MPDFLVAFLLLVALLVLVIIFVWGMAAIRHRYRCKKHEWELLVSLKRYWTADDNRAACSAIVYSCKNCGKLVKIKNEA